jgi:hypothetical protein
VPRFPKSEPEIAHLAQQMAAGLERAAEEFPIPPVPPVALQALLDDYDDYKEKSADRLELLRDQPRGVDLEFRVLARNRAGTGGPSATVKAVL